MSLLGLVAAIGVGNAGVPDEAFVPAARLGVDTFLTVSYGARRFFLVGNGRARSD